MIRYRFHLAADITVSGKPDLERLSHTLGAAVAFSTVREALEESLSARYNDVSVRLELDESLTEGPFPERP